MTDATNFTGLSTVAIPATDQDRTRALLEDLGFETRYDGELQEGFRWVELAPPDGGSSISLVVAGEALPAGIDTGIRLVTPDARATHAELRRRGLPVGELLDWDTAIEMPAWRHGSVDRPGG